MKIQLVQLYNSTDTATARKNSYFILSERSDFHTVINLLIAVHVFPLYKLICWRTEVVLFTLVAGGRWGSSYSVFLYRNHNLWFCSSHLNFEITARNGKEWFFNTFCQISQTVLCGICNSKLSLLVNICGLNRQLAWTCSTGFSGIDGLPGFLHLHNHLVISSFFFQS